MHRAALALVTALACAGCSAPTPPGARTSEPPRATPTAGAPAAQSAAPATSASPAPPVRPPYLASARWLDVAGTRVLRVRPTPSGRSGPPPDALWAELVRLAPAAARPGMRDQLLCHAAFAAEKAVWNLEPARPAVGLAETVAARCNPGGLRDPDLASPTS